MIDNYTKTLIFRKLPDEPWPSLVNREVVFRAGFLTKGYCGGYVEYGEEMRIIRMYVVVTDKGEQEYHSCMVHDADIFEKAVQDYEYQHR
jgi:hypothetical protein